MKRTMVICELPPIEDHRKVITTIVSIQSPGIARHTNIMTKSTVGIITRANGHASPMDLIPVVIFEVDPDAEFRDRKLIIIPPNMTVSVEEPRRIQFLGVFTHPKGIPFYLFEELEAGNGEE